MSDINDTVDRYIAAWNETDPAARRAAIDAVATPDVTYVDPIAVAISTGGASPAAMSPLARTSACVKSSCFNSASAASAA